MKLLQQAQLGAKRGTIFGLASSPEFIGIATAVVLLLVPTYARLAEKVWDSDSQGHGPIVLGVSVWLAWQRRAAFLSLPMSRGLFAPSLLLTVASLLYVIGRSQRIDTVEVAAAILLVTGGLALYRGIPGIRVMAFPLFFLLFTIPIPGIVAQTLTVPLKSAVSFVASELLALLDYPVARTGVILQIGVYKLLVADACAGLASIFTLEALGLLYLNLTRHTSIARNAFLAAATLPVAFGANVIRVVALCLVTYHLGDEAGQGFLHGLAGMTLFISALAGLLVLDLCYERVAYLSRTVRQ